MKRLKKLAEVDNKDLAKQLDDYIADIEALQINTTMSADNIKSSGSESTDNLLRVLREFDNVLDTYIKSFLKCKHELQK